MGLFSVSTSRISDFLKIKYNIRLESHAAKLSSSIASRDQFGLDGINIPSHNVKSKKFTKNPKNQPLDFFIPAPP